MKSEIQDAKTSRRKKNCRSLGVCPLSGVEENGPCGREAERDGGGPAFSGGHSL